MSGKSNNSEQYAGGRPWAIGTKQDRDYWEEKYEQAVLLMESRRSIPSILIEVAAQHPLINGMYPNEEFTQRLLLAVELYRREMATGARVEIYVPGSVHMMEGKPDRVSLSSAGRQFLLEHGFPESSVKGDELNLKYKGDDGVYNSADECFVSASYFKDEGFGKLYSVLSPVQVFRKTLHYLEFGVLPLNFTAPTSLMFHNYIGEIFEAVPYVLLVDHTLQASDSIRAKELRKMRKPG
jgi:hypothetical protein